MNGIKLLLLFAVLTLSGCTLSYQERVELAVTEVKTCTTKTCIKYVRKKYDVDYISLLK